MREFACLRFAAAGILAAFLSLGAGGAAKALYDVEPSEIPGRPGSIIRIWPLEGGGPGMGGNGEAFRILYRSTDPSGRPIPVSGAIYIPNGPAPAGGRSPHRAKTREERMLQELSTAANSKLPVAADGRAG